MSLITRCPTCETMFRVVPDQLRVSEGWVRCGHCSEVFDATQNMVPPAGGPAADAAPPPTPQPPAPAARATPPPSQGAASPAAPIPTAAAQASATAATGSWVSPAPGAGSAQPPVPEAPPAAAWDAAIGDANTARADAAPRYDDALLATAAATREPDWLDAPQTDPETAILPREEDDPDGADTVPPPALDFPPDVAPGREPGAAPPVQAGPAAPAASAAPDAPADPAPSFLRGNDQPSVWRRPAVRIALAIVLALLLGLLGMQFLVKERNRVAAMQPAMRPLLEAACALADCTIGPLRQIESIVIDSSSFSRVRGDDYRLGFSLKNTAPIDVAMPAIELSLTDPQDQPVIRRVILPAEFGARSEVLASASIWTGALALTVQPDIGAQRIAGYRLLAFYP